MTNSVEPSDGSRPSLGRRVARRFSRLALLAAIACCIFYAALMIGAFFLYPLFLYHPDPDVTLTPDSLGEHVWEDVWIEAEDGCRLNGWFIPANPETRNGTTLLVFHGNAGNLSSGLMRVLLYAKHGFDVFMVDYHGFGKSEGEPNETNLYRSARAAWRYVTETRGVPAPDVVILGYSLGGAVASWLAANEPEAGGLVLESTFTSLADVAGQLFPWLPARLVVGDGLNTMGRLDDIDMPLLVVHGKGDKLVDYANSERIHAAFKGDKRFLEIAADHNTGFLQSQDAYIAALRDFAAAARAASE